MTGGLSGLVATVLLFSAAAESQYCQPTESCWPTEEEITEFENSLSPVGEDCFGFPTFSSKDKQGDNVNNIWYDDAPDTITPYELLNLRNRISEIKAFFVVLARNETDVSRAIEFATAHKLGLSVFGTGHEFNDRNAGKTDNSLLVRTMCLRVAEIDLDPANRFGHPDGVARLGAGFTWGESKFGEVGVHQLAAEQDRVVVSGHAGNVGIVGWSMGGGHGQLVGTYGMGVDQILEVELVAADGSRLIANELGVTRIGLADGVRSHSEDTELFWALRGGGAGPWGIVTALTLKLHANRNNCKAGCFTQHAVLWESNFIEDDGQLAVDVLTAYLSWSATVSKYWSSYASLIPAEDGVYYISIGDALYVGQEEDEGDFNSFYDTFSKVRTDRVISYNNVTFDRFLDKMLAQAPETVYTAGRTSPMVSVLMNSTVVQQPDTAKLFVNNWIPRCYKELTPCVAFFLFMQTVSNGEEDDFYTGTAVSPAFRQAKMHVGAITYLSLAEELTTEATVEFAHNTLGPEMYSLSEGSYYSESEFSLESGQWQNRFWTRDIYDRLLAVKRQYDPNFVFGCRHCVGDEEEPIVN